MKIKDTDGVTIGPGASGVLTITIRLGARALVFEAKKPYSPEAFNRMKAWLTADTEITGFRPSSKYEVKFEDVQPSEAVTIKIKTRNGEDFSLDAVRLPPPPLHSNAPAVPPGFLI